MSLAEQMPPQRAAGVVEFGFVPIDLIRKCGRLIHVHHTMRGYSSLPDELWTNDIREFIESYRSLQLVLKRAAPARSAKTANECYALIATVILSLEMLASDFAGWGARCPRARRTAIERVAQFFPTRRSRLMDVYLPPRLNISTDMLEAMAPS